jgi:hypothetical protein
MAGRLTPTFSRHSGHSMWIVIKREALRVVSSTGVYAPLLAKGPKWRDQKSSLGSLPMTIDGIPSARQARQKFAAFSGFVPTTPLWPGMRIDCGAVGSVADYPQGLVLIQN